MLLENPAGDRTSFSYDAAGRRTAEMLANGTRGSYTYDAASRLVLLDNLKSDFSAISSFDYAYDAAGNRIRVIEADGDRTTWTYDAATRLTAEHRSGVSGYHHTFTYDATGNRLTRDDDTDLTTYTYDPANRLVTAVDGSGSTTYTFDADGNRRSVETPAGDLATNTWSAANQLLQVEQPQGEVSTYTWALVQRDNTPQRVTRDDGTDAARFVWDENRLLAELDDMALPVAAWTVEPVPFGNLISQARDAETAYYHYDTIGSTRELTDAAQVTTDDYTSDAFGQTVVSGGATENPFRWVGRQGYYYDADTGRYLLRQRGYDSGTGRFLSEDPIRADEENLYRYVRNDPVNETDPSGLEGPDFTQPGYIPCRGFNCNARPEPPGPGFTIGDLGDDFLAPGSPIPTIPGVAG